MMCCLNIISELADILQILQKFIRMDQQKKENIKYRLIAHIVQLNLNKNLNFQTKVSWKRNVNKAETETVTHRNCCSVFDERLQLQLNLVYNHADNKFEPKLTEFSVVVIYQGKIKSGGFAKYDAADIVNNNFNGQNINLALVQCPDPNATLQIIFDYETIGDSSRSLFNELSMINPSNEPNLSQINFPEEQSQHQSLNNTDIVPIDTNDLIIQKQSVKEVSGKEREITKINSILDKFEAMSKKIKPSQKSLFADDQNTTKNESLQISSIPPDNEEKLKLQINELQNELELKALLIAQYQKKLNEAGKKIQQGQIKLQLAQQTIDELKAARESIKIEQALIQSQRKYRELYQRTQKELQQIKDNLSNELNFSKNHNFKKFVEEVQAIDQIPCFQQALKPVVNQSHRQRIQDLERQSIQLQTKIAEMSHNIAQLFNAAYEYGGPKLLDYLQGSIGLTEQES